MSNLKFQHPVHSFAEAEALYERGVETLAYNTWLVKARDGYEVVHHSTPILTFHADGSCTIDAAWVSATTANRLHHCKPETVERINRDHGAYRVTLSNHPGVFYADAGERYRIFPDRTVVKV